MRYKMGGFLAIFTVLLSVFVVVNVKAAGGTSASSQVTIPASTLVETSADITFTGTWEDYYTSRQYCSQVFSVSDDIYGTFTGTGWVDKYVVTLTSAKLLRISISFRSGNTGFIKWMNGQVKYSDGSTDSWMSNSGSVSMPTLYLKPGTYEFQVGFTQASGAPMRYTFRIG